MGILKSKKMKLREKHPYNKDINGTSTEEAAEKETDLPGNLNNTTNTSQGQGHTQLFSHQMEPSHGNEAMLTRMHQVPAFDVPQNREQSTRKAVNLSLDADPVKYIPYLASAVRVTQQHTSLANPKDNKTSTPKQMDALKSDLLQRFQGVSEIICQKQTRPSAAQVQQQAEPVQHQRKQHENRQVMFGLIQHKEDRHFPPSEQNPAAKETTEVPLHTASASVHVPAQVLCKDASPHLEFSFGSKEQQDMMFQFPAPKRQAHVHRICKRRIKGVTTENLLGKEAETQTKTKFYNPPSQKSNWVLSNVNESSLTCLATDEAHNIAEQSATTKLFIAEVPAAMPAEPPGNSRQMSSQPKAQVSDVENVLNSVTNVAVDHQYWSSAKSKSSHAFAAKMRQRQKLAKKIKSRSDGKSSHQTAGETVYAAMEENATKKHEPHQISQPNKADNDTNGSTCIQKVKVNAPALQVLVVEEIPTGAPNNAVTHNPTTSGPDTSTGLQHEPKGPQDTAVKPKKKRKLKEVYQNLPKNTGSVTAKEEINGNMEEEINGMNSQAEKEKHEPAITSAVAPDLVCAEGRWHPFTVNQSCSHRVHCRHNPGTGLPQNVQKWFYECPNYLCEPAWIITARLAVCIALKLTVEEEEDSHQ